MARPDDDSPRLRRIEAAAALGRWTVVAADLARLGPSPEVRKRRYWLALAQLGAGDLRGYRATCRSMLDQWSDTKEIRAADYAAWTCALGTSAVPDLGRAVRLSEGTVAQRPKSASLLNTLGTILYRAGRYAEAVRRLQEAVAAGGEGGAAHDWLVLAMARQRLGQRVEARRALARARQLLREKPATTWNERLELELFRKEAEAAVRAH
jgi:Tfp pilus assembly protein PilF